MAEPKTSQIPVGATLAGKYRVTREIGRGGMAAVYEAENTLIGKRVAVKVLAAELASSKVVVERFVREARAAAAISSPYICDVYDAAKLADGRPFLVLELLQGESLYDRMVRERHMAVGDVVRIVSQVARGLTRAHAAGIVHRDLKPENVFLTRDEDGNLVSKILDFGLAKMYAPVAAGGKQARLTREGAIFGTPAYMSPEQINGQGHADHRADLWALGCITYELLTGRTVWSTDQGVAMTFAQIASWPLPDPLTTRRDLPASFRSWFHRALARDANERFQSAKELADALADTFEVGPDSRSPASLRRIEPPLRQPAPRAEPLDSSDIEVLEPVPSRRRTPVDPTPAVAPLPFAAPPNVAPPQLVLPQVPASRPRPPTPAPPVPARPLDAPRVAPAPAAAAPFAPPIAPRGDRAPLLTLSAGATSSTVDRGRASTVPPFRARRSAAAWIGGLVAIAAVGASAALVGGRVLETGGSREGITVVAPAPAPASPAESVDVPAIASVAAPAPATSAAPFVPAKWSAAVIEAQQRLAAGDTKAADRLLRQAAALAPNTTPRALLSHLATTSRSTGPCRLTGLARPRPADVAGPAARPAVAYGPGGAVAAWIDDHESPGHPHAWGVRLDASLVPIGAPRDLTPEADEVQHVVLASTDAQLAAAWSDPRAGVFVRGLDVEGRIATAPVVVASRSAGRREPDLEPAPDGSFWTAWEDGREGASSDVFLRHLGPSLALDGPEIRATDYAGRGGRPRVHGPMVGVSSGVVGALFGWERAGVRRVALLRVLLDDADLRRGLDGAPATGAVDRTIGTSSAIVPDEERADDADMACGGQSCFLAWRSGGGSLSVALLDVGDGRLVWRKRFELRGGRPAVSVAPSGVAALAWSASGQLRIASLGREGLGKPAIVGRAAGDLVRPSLAAGARVGEWLVGWLDFEAGRPEAFVARATCPGG